MSVLRASVCRKLGLAVTAGQAEIYRAALSKVRALGAQPSGGYRGGERVEWVGGSKPDYATAPGVVTSVSPIGGGRGDRVTVKWASGRESTQHEGMIAPV